MVYSANPCGEQVENLLVVQRRKLQYVCTRGTQGELLWCKREKLRCAEGILVVQRWVYKGNPCGAKGESMGIIRGHLVVQRGKTAVNEWNYCGAKGETAVYK